MRHEKYAVFQVSDGEGMMRLICVDGPTFSDSVALERALRSQGARHLHVIFLGRFDRVEIASGVLEFIDLTLGTGVGRSCVPVPTERPYLLRS